MKKRKLTPEERERRRQMNEDSLRARAQLQAALDKAATLLERWENDRQSRRRSLRYRLNPFRRAT